MNFLHLTIEQIFAASLLGGFLYSLLLGLCGGRIQFVQRFLRFRTTPKLISIAAKFGRKQISSKRDFAPPWAFPILGGTFLIGFGLTGLILRVPVELSPKTSALLALTSSATISVVMVMIAKRFLSDSAAPIQGNALYGTVGYVSLTVPESGIGSVAYVADGKRVTMPARSRNGVSILKGKQVVIVDLETKVALVEEY